MLRRSRSNLGLASHFCFNTGLFEATDELEAKKTPEALQHVIDLTAAHFKDEVRMGKCSPAHIVRKYCHRLLDLD